MQLPWFPTFRLIMEDFFLPQKQIASHLPRSIRQILGDKSGSLEQARRDSWPLTSLCEWDFIQ
jgi:hypothetical protein